MSKILVIAQHDGKALSSATARAVACARAIGGDIAVAVFADNAEAPAAAAAKLDGVSQVLKIERAENAAPLAAVLAPQIAALGADFTHVIMASTTFGKDVLPRAAALDRAMKALGLNGDPYLPVDEPPADYGKLRRYRHPRFQFQPLPGYEKST